MQRLQDTPPLGAGRFICFNRPKGRGIYPKGIKEKEVSVQCVNLYGTLGYGKKWRIPDRIESIFRVSGSTNTLVVQFNNGWRISFRLHSASGKVESSLKFDINLIASPTYVEKHSIP
jgi:hypothetical protein